MTYSMFYVWIVQNMFCRVSMYISVQNSCCVSVVASHDLLLIIISGTEGVEAGAAALAMALDRNQ